MPAEQYGREAKHLQLVQLQQVHYPSDPMQPGPIYFTPRKCAIFGVCCESIPRQVFFLIDEAMNIGKGANAIMSMLHYYFKHHASGKALWISMLTIAQAKIKTIHWFNICSGGSWQSSTSISHSHFSFLVRERVSCLEDIVKTVKSSTVNVAQLVGTQDGQVIVPMYVTGLHTFLSTFESSYESRSITTFSSPQSVLVASLRAPMQKRLRRRLIWYLVTVGLQVVISCLTRRTMSTSMVSVWKHKGVLHTWNQRSCLSKTWYKPQNTASTTQSRAKNAHSEPPSTPPPTKKAWLCGFCRNPGHTAHSCPHKDS